MIPRSVDFGKSLRDQKVIPDSDAPIQDDDLYRISEIYTERSRFWVCLTGAQVIGTIAILEATLSTARLKCMFVATRYHGQGIGQRLLDRAMDFARSQGYTAIVLTTHPLMQRAHRFYERNGFMRTADDGEMHAYQIHLS